MKDPTPKEVLAALRASTELSVERFAIAIGVVPSNYRRYESGQTRKVPADVLDAARLHTPRLIKERQRREREGK